MALTDAQKVMRNDTGMSIAARLGEIADAIASGTRHTVYGFHIDGAESDPEAKVTYLADAVGMTPAYMDFVNEKFVWGSWKDAFFMPRPCMLGYDGVVDYYLDPSDYSKKAQGGASDVSNLDYPGNAMMEWGRDGKKIWYKIVPDDGDATSASIYVADYQADDNFHAWSFINSQGKLVDHFYTPCFNGYSDINNVMRSIAGVTPSNSLDVETERNRCRANNTADAIWDTEVYCDITLVNIFLTLIGKSTDSQSVFGQGMVNGGSEAGNANFKTGQHMDKGLFYGTSDGAGTNVANAVKVFGMENWWGYQWRRFGGLVNAEGTAKYKLTRGTSDGTAMTDYVVSTSATDYAGYLTGAAVPAASGAYINTLTFDGNQWTPTAATGSASTHYCDGLWMNNSRVDYAYRGGSSDNGARCGAFSLALNNPAGAASWYIGASPSCKPLS